MNGLLAGFVELEKENIPSRKVFSLSLSLSLSGRKNYTSVCSN